MSQGGETEQYSVEDHVRAIQDHLYEECIDIVIVNETPIPKYILEKYEHKASHSVELKESNHAYRIVKDDLLDLSQGLVRHNESKLATLIETLLKES